MFTEVVKLETKLDRSALNRMFNSLNQRFGKVAKRFGSGLKNALKLSAITAVANVLISKFLNPLQKTEEVLDRILSRGDAATTNAEQLGTDSGSFMRLQSLAAAKGVDDETLKDMLTKFQIALAKEKQAVQTGGPAGRLRNFVDEEDTSKAFFKFVQAIQRLEKSQQVVVQAELFGDDVIKKGAKFFNATDFAEILKQLPTTKEFNLAARRTGVLADRKTLNTVVREAQDFVTKSSLVSESQVEAIDRSEREKLLKENESLARFDSLMPANIAIQELTHKLDALATELIQNTAPALVTGLNKISEYSGMLLSKLAEFSVKIDGIWGEFKQSKLYKFSTSFFGN